MEHIAALLLIVGCSDDFNECKELPAPAPIFETARECDDAMETTMRGMVGDYPQILARCVSVDPSAEYGDAQLVWDINRRGDLTAFIESLPGNGNAPDASAMVASNATGQAGRGER